MRRAGDRPCASRLPLRSFSTCLHKRTRRKLSLPSGGSTMNLFHPQIAAALAATISLAACIAPPAAPTIPVAPGPSKTWTCSAPIRPPASKTLLRIVSAVAAANNQTVGGALLGGALGAGLGAGIGAAAGNAGKGAAIGAASGGALGMIGNADGAPYPQESLQQQYDIPECTGSAWPPTGTLSPASPRLQAPRPIPENSRPTLAVPRLDHADAAAASRI